LIIQKSKFISYAFKVYDLNQVKRKLDLLKKKHKKANHHCYAYVLSLDSSIQKSSDDGEPSSTAGKPILNQIKINDLTNILIVVVRYFGGKKLGISGLINAYKTSSNELIKKCKIKSKEIIDIYEIEFEESNKHNLLNAIKKNNFKYENLNQGACNIHVKRSYTKSLENLNIFLTNKKYLSSE
jgi:uncharacterized YigZ family protein